MMQPTPQYEFHDQGSSDTVDIRYSIFRDGEVFVLYEPGLGVEAKELPDLLARLATYEAALRYVLEDDGLVPRATSKCREVVRKALETP